VARCEHRTLAASTVAGVPDAISLVVLKS